MLYLVELELTPCLWSNPSQRYELLSRWNRILRGAGIPWFGFALYGGRLRALVEAERGALVGVLNHFAGGTRRAAEARGAEGRVEHRYSETGDFLAALVALHRPPGGLDPLCFPWTSYRDLVGFRTATFFDPTPTLARVDLQALQTACGGGPIERVPPEKLDLPEELLYPLSAAICGVVPADRACFRLFAHLSRAAGLSRDHVARTLGLTPRRITQLLSEPEPLFTIGLCAASDPRLCVVP